MAAGGMWMSGFDFYFTFYGLILGLSVAQVASGFANALNSRRRSNLGFLTPLLSLFVLLDITTFWLYAWALRDQVTVTYGLMFGGLVVTITYYLAASLIFPREGDDWASLDEHYWSQKRLVIAGILAANLVVFGFTVFKAPPAWTDWIYWAWWITYYLPLAVLLISKDRRIDAVLLSWLLICFVVAGLNLLPASQWNAAAGLS